MREACCTRCRPAQPGAREPIQIGAEIYGHGGIDSDVEIQRLMMEALTCAGLPRAAARLGPRGTVSRLDRAWRHRARTRAGVVASPAQQGLPGAAGATSRRCRRPIGRGVAGAGELYGGTQVLRQARQRLARPSGDPRCPRRPANGCRGRSRSFRVRCSSISASCAATTITPASCSRPTAKAIPTRSAAAGATTRSDTPSDGLVPPPASALDLRDIAATGTVALRREAFGAVLGRSCTA